MRALIINADDLGADEERNHGIFQGINAGIITSVSILVNAPAFQTAVDTIRKNISCNVSYGIHINLSEGKPLSNDLSLLVAADGSFLGKAKARERLCSRPAAQLKEEVMQEVRTQITALKQTGLTVSHIDGHQHVHVFPGVWDSVLQAAREFEIPWIRIPDEPVRTGQKEMNQSLFEEAKRFSETAATARPDLQGKTLAAPDHFRGLYLKGQLSPSVLVNLINQLPEGLTELMVHPGRANTHAGRNIFSTFSTPDRERELEALLDPAVSAAIQNANVLLTPFPFSA